MRHSGGSGNEPQRQQTDGDHRPANQAQPARIELAHLLGHALPCLRRGEQEQAFEYQYQAQRGGEGVRHGVYLPPSPLLASK